MDPIHIESIGIVDDSWTARSAIRRLLDAANVEYKECVEATNGREALDLLRSHPVGLLIADLNMPEMDGETMVEEIRADVDLKDTPIIIVSTDGCIQRQDRLLDLGVVICLHKPFEHEVLADAIRRVINEPSIPGSRGN